MVLKEIGLWSVITDYFINFFSGCMLDMLVSFSIDNLNPKETLEPCIGVNIKKNFSSGNSACQTLILGVNTVRKMYH